MLKKTLIAFATLSSLSVIVPAQAQAQGWGGHAESHVSPNIRYVAYSHADRNEYRHQRPHYRYVDDRFRGHHDGRHYGHHPRHYQGWDRGHDRHDRGHERGYSRHGDRH